MRRIILFLIILALINILTINSVCAKKAYASLDMYVINEPPRITGMGIYGFAETGLRCNASVEDEYKEKAKVHYYWYKNDELIGTDEALDKNLIKKNDKITCKAVPDDNAQLGNPENVTTAVIGEPAGMKINRITGNVVGSISSNKGASLVGLLLFLSAALMIFDLLIARSWFVKKRILIQKNERIS